MRSKIFKTILYSVMTALILTFSFSLTACTEKHNFCYQYAKWRAEDGNTVIEVESRGSGFAYGTLTISDMSADIIISPSERANTFSIYKNYYSLHESGDWLKTDVCKCICLGDYTYENDTVTLTILYDYTEPGDPYSLAGKTLVLKKYE